MCVWVACLGSPAHLAALLHAMLERLPGLLPCSAMAIMLRRELSVSSMTIEAGASAGGSCTHGLAVPMATACIL